MLPLTPHPTMGSRSQGPRLRDWADPDNSLLLVFPQIRLPYTKATASGMLASWSRQGRATNEEKPHTTRPGATVGNASRVLVLLLTLSVLKGASWLLRIPGFPEDRIVWVLAG